MRALCGETNDVGIDQGRTVKPTSGKTLLTVLLGGALAAASFGTGAAAAPATPRTCTGSAPSDFNGDGVSDAAIGEPGSNLADPGSGAVHILYGSKSGLLVDATSSTPDDQILTATNVPNAAFGESVAALDFNGDGCSDLAVGAPNDTPFGVSGAGRVWFYFGSPDGLTPSGQLPIDSQSATGVFPQPGAAFGAALTGGDTTGDGLDDLVIGAPAEVVDGVPHGAVYVLPGRSTGAVVPGARLAQGEGAVPASDGQSDSFGSSLAVGDFTGDGKGDLAIGAPTYQGTVGAVDTLQSTGTGTLVSFTNGTLWTHHVAGDDFGRSLAVGDFAGTGVDQLAIGAPGQGGFGAVSLIQGTTQPTLTTVTSGLSLLGDVALGTTLAAGDFNGDGKDDLAIGDPRGTVDGGDLGPDTPLAGQVFLDYAVIQGNGLEIWHQAQRGLAEVPEPGDEFGASLAVVHLNGEVADLIVGVPGEDLEVADQGMIHVIRGSVKFGLISKGSQVFSDETPGIQGTAVAESFFGAAAT